MPVRVFQDQTLASTNLDRQGERLSKMFLESFRNSMGGRRFPVHQQHDMRRAVSGYIENARLVPDPDNSGEWRLIGDVYVDEGTVEDVLGGFSISGVEVIHQPEEFVFALYLPFPHYNDEEFVAEFKTDQQLSVGKWIKKGADPSAVALIASVLVFAITPVWDDVYKRKIAPRLDDLLANVLPALGKKGLATELVQVIQFAGVEVEVRLIPARGKENECLRSETVEQGLRVVVEFLKGDTKSAAVGVKRVVIFFDEGIGAYKLHRLEFLDGQVEHVA